MKKVRMLTVVAAMALTAAACCALGCDGDSKQPVPAHDPVAIEASGVRYVVKGYEWGPAVPKLIIDFDEEVSGVDKGTFAVEVWNKGREVSDVYVCDENGERAQSGSSIAVDMPVKYGEASPFGSRSKWSNKYKVKFTVSDGKKFSVGDAEYMSGDTLENDCTAESRMIPQLGGWVRDTVSTGEGDETITLTRGSWAPEGAKTDGVANPLIVWLHGAGEGGTDIDLALLGSEVTALTTENELNVQHYFKTGGSAGAYVLAVQTPTRWMDDGSGTTNDNLHGEEQVSKYTETLMKAITSFAETCGDVDTDRIYIGGCSNGGYMTLNMMFNHSDYFAAYYPLCASYMNENISDEMIARTKDCKAWFVVSEDDAIIDPTRATLPLYYRYMAAGARNMHLTYLDGITGKDEPTKYEGHWAWVPALNDDVRFEFDNAAIAADFANVTISADGALTSVDNYVKPANCTVAANMWQWLAEQTKAQA